MSFAINLSKLTMAWRRKMSEKPFLNKKFHVVEYYLEVLNKVLNINPTQFLARRMYLGRHPTVF